MNERDEFVGFPGGVAAPDLGVAFVGGNAGTVDAIRLEDGSASWSVPVRGAPVLVSGDALYVRRRDRELSGKVVLVELDAATGEQRRSLTIELPIEVAKLQAAGDFELEVARQGSVLVLDWRSRRSYGGGAPPPAAVEKSFEQDSRGRLTFGLIEGEVVEAREAPPAPPSTPESSHAYRQRDRWQGSSWKVAGGRARLRLDDSRTPPTLRLEVTPGNEIALRTAVPIAEGTAVEPVVTSDGRYLFIRQTVPPGRPWRVFDVLGGSSVAELPYREGDRDPCVLDGRAYLLRVESKPGTTHTWVLAVDLESAESLWRYDLGEIESQPPTALRQKSSPAPPGPGRQA